VSWQVYGRTSDQTDKFNVLSLLTRETGRYSDGLRAYLFVVVVVNGMYGMYCKNLCPLVYMIYASQVVEKYMSMSFIYGVVIHRLQLR